jgi:hypothetical protein
MDPIPQCSLAALPDHAGVELPLDQVPGADYLEALERSESSTLGIATQPDDRTRHKHGLSRYQNPERTAKILRT